MSKQQTLIMKRDKDCKHSVRYASQAGKITSDESYEPDALSSVYISRSWLSDPTPLTIKLTVEQ